MSKSNSHSEAGPLCNIVFLGDRGVGKTMMIDSLMNPMTDYLDPSVLLKSLPTSELLFHKYCPEIEDSSQKYFDCYFIDTPGDLNLNKYFSCVLETSNIIIILYDITNKESFDHVKDWLQIANPNKSNFRHIYVIGNKGDLSLVEMNVIDFTKGQKLVQDEKLNWFWEYSSVTKIAKPNILCEIAKSCKQLNLPEVPKKEHKKRHEEYKKNKKEKKKTEEKIKKQKNKKT